MLLFSAQMFCARMKRAEQKLISEIPGRVQKYCKDTDLPISSVTAGRFLLQEFHGEVVSKRVRQAAVHEFNKRNRRLQHQATSGQEMRQKTTVKNTFVDVVDAGAGAAPGASKRARSEPPKPEGDKLWGRDLFSNFPAGGRNMVLGLSRNTTPCQPDPRGRSEREAGDGPITFATDAHEFVWRFSQRVQTRFTIVKKHVGSQEPNVLSHDDIELLDRMPELDTPETAEPERPPSDDDLLVLEEIKQLELPPSHMPECELGTADLLQQTSAMCRGRKLGDLQYQLKVLIKAHLLRHTKDEPWDVPNGKLVCVA